MTVLVRTESLADSMSDYLIREIAAAPNVAVQHGVQVVDGTGADHLESLVLEDTATRGRQRVAADGLFVLIGSEPRTEWLGDAVARDRWGFVLTGQEVLDDPAARWPAAARRCRMRRACLGCSPPVMSGGERSSESPPRWGKAQSPSRSCTATWKPVRCPWRRGGDGGD